MGLTQPRYHSRAKGVFADLKNWWKYTNHKASLQKVSKSFFPVILECCNPKNKNPAAYWAAGYEYTQSKSVHSVFPEHSMMKIEINNKLATTTQPSGLSWSSPITAELKKTLDTMIAYVG